MKKIITTVIFLLAVLTTQAQCTLPYKALSTFGKDTTAFMKHNFKDRALCYKGKTVANVVADLGIPVKYYTYRTTKNRDTNGIIMVTSIHIYIYDGNLVGKRLDSRLNGNKDKLNAIRIIFETPFEYNPNRSLLINNKNGTWKTEISNFFSTKKVSEIQFSE